MNPETHYTQCGTVNIAYQVFGRGTHDLVIVPGWLSNIDTFWDEPRVARFFQGFADFARVILFDKRGTGLSDRVTDMPTLEERMDDLGAVMSAIGSERAALLGYAEGGPMCALFAATHPNQATSLILVGSYARRMVADDYPWGETPEAVERFLSTIRNDWGGPVGLEQRGPTVADDLRFRLWWCRYLKMSASPASAVALTKMNAEIDVRHILPSIRTPTLVLHARGDRTVPVEAGRDMASRIPGAKFIELDTEDHLPYVGCSKEIIDEIRRFIGGERVTSRIDRVLATVMFTDIADSTRLAAELGDRAWRDLLNAHHAAIRVELEIFRGREVKTTGDGFHATFDGPGRAIKCAYAIRESTRKLGLDVRIGCHTGECEVQEDSMEGLAIHIAARVSSTAGAGEIVVSRTVKDLVAGSGVEFEDFGVQSFKGVPDEWQLYKVTTV